MRYWFLFRLPLIQRYRSINPEKYEPSNNYDRQTPVKVNSICPVNRNPTQKQENQNIIHKLYHINVVQLTKPRAFHHNLFNVILCAHRVLYPHPFIRIFFLVNMCVLRILFCESYRDYVLRMNAKVFIGFYLVNVYDLVLQSLKDGYKVWLKLFLRTFWNEIALF